MTENTGSFHNVLGRGGKDGVPGTGGFVNTVIEKPARKYWGEGAYANVTLHLDPRVWKRIKHMAINEDSSISALVSEGLTTWLYELAKISKKEAKAEEKEAAQKEEEEIEKLLQEMRYKLWGETVRTRKAKKHDKALKSQAAWKRVYPKLPWPGLKGRRWVKDSEPDTGE